MHNFRDWFSSPGAFHTHMSPVLWRRCCYHHHHELKESRGFCTSLAKAALNYIELHWLQDSSLCFCNLSLFNIKKAGNTFSLIMEHWKPSRRSLACWRSGVVCSGHFCHCLKCCKVDFPHSKIKGYGAISQLPSLSPYIHLWCLDIGICKIDENKTLDNNTSAILYWTIFFWANTAFMSWQQVIFSNSCWGSKTCTSKHNTYVRELSWICA